MLNKLFASSQNPEEVSMTVKSTLLLLVPVIIGLAKYYGFDQITDESIKGFIDLIAQIIQGVLSLIALGGIAWGMLRKFTSR